MVTTERRKWLALALLSAVQFMVVLDIAVVNVALPSIKVDLGFSQEDLQWVISAYALVFGGLLLLGGRAADLLGRRRVFLAGVIVFTLASLFAGLAWSEQSLIGARALQGLGAAIISPAALSMLSTTFAEGRSATSRSASGARSAASVPRPASCSAGCSPTRSAGSGSSSSTSRSAWRRSCWRRSCSNESRDAHVKRFDAPGAALVTVGLSSLVYAITQAGQEGWLAARTLASSPSRWSCSPASWSGSCASPSR